MIRLVFNVHRDGKSHLMSAVVHGDLKFTEAGVADTQLGTELRKERRIRLRHQTGGMGRKKDRIHILPGYDANGTIAEEHADMSGVIGLRRVRERAETFKRYGILAEMIAPPTAVAIRRND